MLTRCISEGPMYISTLRVCVLYILQKYMQIKSYCVGE